MVFLDLGSRQDWQQRKIQAVWFVLIVMALKTVHNSTSINLHFTNIRVVTTEDNPECGIYHQEPQTASAFI